MVDRNVKHLYIKNFKQLNRNNSTIGFTIVELLVVIVVIGILAAVTIISYTGVSQRAKISSLQSDLRNASTQLEIDRTLHDTYPLTKEAANNGQGLKASPGNILNYTYNSANNSYVLIAANGDLSYYINSDNKAIAKYVTPPPVSFAKTWGGSDADYSFGLAQTTDGGYITTGQTYSYGLGFPSFSDVFIAKYTSDGTLSWSKTWGGASDDDASRSVIQTTDGGYAITGYTYSYGAGYNDAFIAKYTSAGALSWSKTWGGTGYDTSDSIIQTTDGGYAISGGTDSYGTGSGDAFIAKYTSDGTLSWSKTWGGTDYEYSTDIVQSTDGSYAITGYTVSYGTGGGDAFIAKYTSAGALSWSKTWGGDDSISNSIVQTTDGGYAIAGNVFLAKYTSTGTLSWNKTWSGATLSDLVQTTDGGYAATGYYNEDSRAFLAKYASDGILSWSKTWGSGVNSDSTIDLVQTTDGGYAISGYTASYGAGNGDALLIKYTSNGTISGCSSPMCQSPSPTVTSPSPVVTSPSPTVTSPSPVVTSPSPTVTSPSPVVTSPDNTTEPMPGGGGIQ